MRLHQTKYDGLYYGCRAPGDWVFCDYRNSDLGLQSADHIMKTQFFNQRNQICEAIDQIAQENGFTMHVYQRQETDADLMVFRESRSNSPAGDMVREHLGMRP